MNFPAPTLRAWAIIGERIDSDGTVQRLESTSFGRTPEQAVHRYVTMLQPRRVPFADGTRSPDWSEHELRAEPCQALEVPS